MNHLWSVVPESEKLYLDALQKNEKTQYSVVLSSVLVGRLSKSNTDLLKTVFVSESSIRYNGY